MAWTRVAGFRGGVLAKMEGICPVEVQIKESTSTRDGKTRSSSYFELDFHFHVLMVFKFF